MTKQSSLRPFGERIWTVEGPRVRMMMIPFDTRMTVIEIEPGKLLLHSPIKPTDEIFLEIAALGEVKHLVAPNKIHSLGIEPWQDLFPSAETYGSPKFGQSHADIKIDHILSNEAPKAWAEQIDTLIFEGSTFLDEVLLYHRPSQTLIVTDLIQRHIAERENWFWKVVKKSAGVLGPRGGTARDLRATMKDRDAARASAEALLQWDFERVVISHGECITANARTKVESVFEWALK